jgi:hypothetical protein
MNTRRLLEFLAEADLESLREDLDFERTYGRVETF